MLVERDAARWISRMAPPVRAFVDFHGAKMLSPHTLCGLYKILRGSEFRYMYTQVTIQGQA